MSELDWTMKISQSYTASCYPCRGQLIVAHNLAVRGTVVLIHLAFREGANKRGNSSRLTQSFHFFMFEPIFSPVNALNQPI